MDGGTQSPTSNISIYAVERCFNHSWWYFVKGLKKEVIKGICHATIYISATMIISMRPYLYNTFIRPYSEIGLHRNLVVPVVPSVYKSNLWSLLELDYNCVAAVWKG